MVKQPFVLVERFQRGLKDGWAAAYCENDPSYRESNLKTDIPSMRLIAAAITLFTIAFLASDYLFFGFTTVFYLLLALRGFIIVLSFFVISYLKTIRNFKVYDKTVFSYLLIMVLFIILIDSTRPTFYVSHIIIAAMGVLIIYLVVPTRFFYQVVPASVFSVGEGVILALTFRGFVDLGLLTAIISLVFINLVAALSSLQMHAYRWRIYQNSVERKETDRLVAIGQTAGMIGHDIRNPLQAIVSELYIAKQSIADSPMPVETKIPAQESINLIEEQTDYISKIVADLQDYARPLNPEFKEVDLAKIVASLLQTVRIPRKVALKVDVQDAPKIQTDPTLIRRALTNLVNNAVQAMPEGGALILRAEKTGDILRILVRDSGQGIPEEIRPRLFTPLVTTKAKGQGLGLAVVKRIVEALGGTVTFESKMGKGTEFTVNLPIKKQA